MGKTEKLGWTEVTVSDTKGRKVYQATSGDAKWAKSSADARTKRGYSQTTRDY